MSSRISRSGCRAISTAEISPHPGSRARSTKREGRRKAPFFVPASALPATASMLKPMCRRANSSTRKVVPLKAYRWIWKAVAGGPGFEPRLTESESAVLPLNYPPPPWRSDAFATEGRAEPLARERLLPSKPPFGKWFAQAFLKDSDLHRQAPTCSKMEQFFLESLCKPVFV